MVTVIDEELDIVRMLRADLREAASALTVAQARYLVDLYYQIQDFRIQAANQSRQAVDSEEPNRVIQWIHEEAMTMERTIRSALDIYTGHQEVSVWCKSVYGIGPVLAAGLIAHLDITRAPTAGHFWSFAGLNPDMVWVKSQKRPYNARLKTLCWKIGQSFMKFHNRSQCRYGQLYAEQKATYQSKNEAGGYFERAVLILGGKRIGKDTEAYKWLSLGKLPPAQIDAMARRWTVKLFLAHLHGVMYKAFYGTEPPLPYPIAHLGHVHLIEP